MKMDWIQNYMNAIYLIIHKKELLEVYTIKFLPYDGSKLVGCAHGKIYDVILDLRKDSSTFEQWIANELGNNEKLHYVPPGCAHGFQTLEDNSKVLYLMSQVYMPEFSRTAKWNDERYKIKWPKQPTIISKKDS